MEGKRLQHANVRFSLPQSVPTSRGSWLTRMLLKGDDPHHVSVPDLSYTSDLATLQGVEDCATFENERLGGESCGRHVGGPRKCELPVCQRLDEDRRSTTGFGNLGEVLLSQCQYLPLACGTSPTRAPRWRVIRQIREVVALLWGLGLRP